MDLGKLRVASRVIRSLSVASARNSLASALGSTFGGKRDMYGALGYQTTLTAKDFRQRYKRGGVAARIVEALPKATWRGGVELIENSDPEVITPFEEGWMDLEERLGIWSVFCAADILAGLGAYSIIFIGAPGAPESELPAKLAPEDIVYLQPYAEDEAVIDSIDDKTESPRFGLPLVYKITRSGKKTKVNLTAHWTRVIHIADETVDDKVYGTPRLERVWNYLDDIDKMTGGGAESFWRRANQGLVFNLDPTLAISPEEAAKVEEAADEMIHDMRRIMGVRGMDVTQLGSDVANFSPQLDAVMSLVAGATSIPKRILMGSERGELASTQDRENWEQRVSDRRTDFAEPKVVRQFVNLLIQRGALPMPNGDASAKPSPKAKAKSKPPAPDQQPPQAAPPPPSPKGAMRRWRGIVYRRMADPVVSPANPDAPQPDAPSATTNNEPSQQHPDYTVQWPEIESLNELERATVADQLSGLNSKAGGTVMTAEEIRDKVLRLDPLTEEQLAKIEADKPPPPTIMAPLGHQFDPQTGEKLPQQAPLPKQKTQPSPKQKPPKGARAASLEDAVLEAADRHEASLRGAFLSAASAAREALDVKTIQRGLQELHQGTVEAALPIGQHTLRHELVDDLERALLNTLEASAQAASQVIARTDIPKMRAARSINIAFDRSNPDAIEWAKRHAGELIVGISREAQAAIRRIIARALSGKLSPVEASRLIQGFIGLTERQASAVENLRERILESPGRRIFAGSQAIRVPKDGMPVARLQDLVQAYADRLLAQRAEMIARTEIIAASNEGQRQLWLQAEEKGLLEGNERRIWLTTEDDRTDEECLDMDGSLAKIDGPFEGPDGQIMNPPLHPNCRCATSLVELTPAQLADEQEAEREEQLA